MIIFLYIYVLLLLLETCFQLVIKLNNFEMAYTYKNTPIFTPIILSLEK